MGVESRSRDEDRSSFRVPQESEARASGLSPFRLKTRIRAGIGTGLGLSMAFSAVLTGLVAVEPLLGLDRLLAQRLGHGQGFGWLISGSSTATSTVTGSALVAWAAIHFILAMALTAYLRKFGQRRLCLVRTQVGLFGTMLLAVIMAKVVLVFSALPPLWMPVALAPLWTAMGFDRRAGFVVAVVAALVLSTLAGFDGVVLCAFLARAMSATLLYFDRRRTRQMISAAFCGGASAAAVLWALLAISGEPLDVWSDLSAPESSLLLASLGGGLLEGVLAVALRGPVERLLGHVSRERLLELTDLGHPLLQRLTERAPGSFEHSRAMANLAEQAANAIGADALLTRVGAYYHDLGKSVRAKHFVENQSQGEVSPHTELAPEESAWRIMNHVVEGTRILREGGIPEPVVEFAYTHHGTQLLEFFWNKYLATGRTDLDQSHFRYPGMRPQTKETAILMLVDSIEAASRTIDPPDRARFDQMVQRIVFTKLSQGQLDESGLSMRELRIVHRRMVDTLVYMNHHRIKYPWQTERAEEFGVPSSAVREPAWDPSAEANESPVEESGLVVSILPPSVEPPEVTAAEPARTGARW